MYKLKIKPNNTIHTQWGNAKLDDNGYYRITSRKEGNHYQYFHRLLFEKYYGKIPKGYQIHHKDKNRVNNCICNLSLLKKEDHLKLHKKGNKHQMSSCFKMSKSKNTVGFFNVYKNKCSKCKQGFIFRYEYTNAEGNRKTISRTNIVELEKAVREKGLRWYKFENSLQGNTKDKGKLSK